MLFDHVPLLAFAWLLALTATAAFTDTRTGLIPNWLTLPALVLGTLAQAAAGGAAGALGAATGVLVCALVPLVMFGLRAIGGGDVKLFAALGALCGASLGLELQLGSYAIAAVVGIAAAARHGRLTALLGRAFALLGRRPPPSHAAERTTQAVTSVRLGAPIFGATLVLGARAALGVQ